MSSTIQRTAQDRPGLEPDRPSRSPRTMVTILIAALVLAGGGYAYKVWGVRDSARNAAAEAPHPRPVPVRAGVVEIKAMPVALTAVGTVRPVASVVVRPRVDSQITEVHVAEGSAVRTGEVLVTLDSRSAVAQLHEAQAQLAKDEAQKVRVGQDLQRYGALVARDFVSKQQYQQAQADQQTINAGIAADQAAIDNLNVQLSYYTITAPIDGRIGRINLKPGNVVRAADTTPLFTINQMNPIQVEFAVPQSRLDEVRTAAKAGGLVVEAQPAGDKAAPVKGKLAFFDNAIDPGSGTITLIALLPNADERLWPGQFVDVTLVLSVDEHAITIPAAALEIGQDGSYVFVIDKDKKVTLQAVTAAQTVAGRTVITKGLNAGEQVVVDGQLRLGPGSRVEILDGGKPAAADGHKAAGAGA
jgi:multidrug efflux system membrane fusion protein